MFHQCGVKLLSYPSLEIAYMVHVIIRGNSLLPVASKMLVDVLLRRLCNIREQLICKEQAGFRSRLGFIDHIFTLHQLLGHHHSYCRPTVFVFLDIRVVFVSFDRTALWNCLLESGVPEKFVIVLKSPHRST
uniref:Reverse transcriptase domain-containing protein n=1 Tax=Trichobilharzia regenti TaxID=157069 RepID=A0AA85KNC7_TRIRE|nr:unnamed protein product [Trichobilharzia regenti]